MRAQVEPIKFGMPYIYNGKVRDTVEFPSYSAVWQDKLAIVASDRISAFDHILPDGIPAKGIVLTQTSNWWMDRLKSIAPNHLHYAVDREKEADELFGSWAKEAFVGRTVIVKRLKMLPIEFIVRGNITGSGWKDYQKTGIVGGHKLPAGLKKSQALPAPILTPSTKAEQGLHDENITCDVAREILFKLGYRDNVWKDCQNYALALFLAARSMAAERGLVLVDTKFEFGLDSSSCVVLGDEVLTPDSSRVWGKAEFEKAFAENREPESFDKQFVRDYLQGLVDKGEWNKDDYESPVPSLPDEIIIKTTDKYLKCNELLTGRASPIVNTLRKEFDREYGV